MKKLFVALSLMFSTTAMAATYVTVEVCDGGESGTECRTVTYRQRPASKPELVKCTVPHGEAGEVPCPTKYGVPGWLKRLNEAFARAGFSAPDTSWQEAGGGN
jgi:hypothetical protein